MGLLTSDEYMKKAKKEQAAKPVPVIKEKKIEKKDENIMYTLRHPEWSELNGLTITKRIYRSGMVKDIKIVDGHYKTKDIEELDYLVSQGYDVIIRDELGGK